MINLPTKRDVKEVFSKNRKAYVSSSTHSINQDLFSAIEWMNLNSGMIALDIATGGGYAAKHMAPYVKRVVATDITKEMLENTAEHLTRHENIDYVIADAEQLPFLDHSFDIVMCRIAAHHFPQPDQFIREVKRVLKNEGRFLLIDNIAPANEIYDTFINRLEKLRDYSHVRSLKIEEWKQLLSKNNMEILRNQKRRKTLPYEEWINRTLDKEKDQSNVAEFMVTAPDNVKEHFEIIIEKGKIQHFTIDEWMVLCTCGEK